MSFPVEAFQTCEIGSLSKGEFFVAGREWYLAVEHVGTSNQNQKLSAIQVSNAITPAGPVWPDLDPPQKVMRIAKPYSTMIYSEAFPTALTGLTGMPVIVGKEPLLYGKLGFDEILFTASGNRLPDKSDLASAIQFSDWSLWIVREDGSKVGGEPLFSVVSQ